MESRNFSPRCREVFSQPGKRKQRKCPKAQEKAWEEGNADAAFPVIFLYRFRWMLAVVCYCCTTQWARLSMDLQTRCLAINKTGHLIAWIGSCRRPQSQHATLSGLREDLLFCPRLRPSVIMSAADDLVLLYSSEKDFKVNLLSRGHWTVIAEGKCLLNINIYSHLTGLILKYHDQLQLCRSGGSRSAVGKIWMYSGRLAEKHLP